MDLLRQLPGGIGAVVKVLPNEALGWIVIAIITFVIVRILLGKARKGVSKLWAGVGSGSSSS